MKNLGEKFFFKKTEISFKEIIIFLKNKLFYFKKTEISFKEIIIFFGAIIGIWFAWNEIKNTKEQLVEIHDNNQKQFENKTKSDQNQQFLEAIQLFENAKTFEGKKGALFHLENLALSSPAHRQRVLDFLNSLNGWMREVDFDDDSQIYDSKNKYIKWENWKNKKQPLIKIEIISKEKQLISAEIPKIYENIIRKHNKEWEKFNEEEKEKYALNFSYFIFPQIDFSGSTFSQEETIFEKSLFLGKTNFNKTNFLGNVNFSQSVFLTEIDFSNSNFSGLTNFSDSKFLEYTNFSDSKFLGIINFYNSIFSNLTDFSYAEFSDYVYFHNTIFLGNTYFSELKSLKYISFYNSIFSNLTDFSYAEFLGGADFSNSNFAKIINFSDSKFLEYTNFSGSKFSKEIDFSDSDFHKCLVRVCKTSFFVIDYYCNKNEEVDFISFENYEKIKASGGIFSNEQIKYFEKLKQEQKNKYLLK